MRLQVRRLEALSAQEREALLERAPALDPGALARAREIVQAVKERGDAALLELTERLDGVSLPRERLRVPPEELRSALSEIPLELREALERAKRNIEAFHAPQRPRSYKVEPLAGLALERRAVPFRRVGLYVPKGLVSSLLMLGVPARLAGVKEIAVCTPPGPDGRVPAPVRAAAARLGIDEVYAVGGAQAIAALAYGTETIPRVEKVAGPGNAYVTAAKAWVRDDVGIDLLAGPSEVALLVEPLPGFSIDELARWAAAELKAQLEHGPGTAALLLTSSPELAELVLKRINAQPPEALQGRALHLLVYEDRARALRFLGEYAPEHLALWLPEPELEAAFAPESRELSEAIKSAGSVFLGPWTPVPLGDYASGTNHVLPTGGQARFLSALGVEHFCKWVEVQRVDPTSGALRALRPTIEALARVEGLPGHAEAVRLRFERLERLDGPNDPQARGQEGAERWR